MAFIVPQVQFSGWVGDFSCEVPVHRRPKLEPLLDGFNLVQREVRRQVEVRFWIRGRTWQLGFLGGGRVLLQILLLLISTLLLFIYIFTEEKKTVFTAWHL